jgi:hypothetical protein
MSINYGRPLPRGPRPKPPLPKLGEVGSLRGTTGPQSSRNKKQKDNNVQASSNSDTQAVSSRPQQLGTTQKKKKKTKLDRRKQNTPVKVEIVRPKPPSLFSSPSQACRVVVEWRRAGRCYLAWGKRGVKAVDGWSECISETHYHQLLKKLHPIGTKLTITDSRIPVVEILDLMIAVGKVLTPKRQGSTPAQVSSQAFPSRQTKRRSRRESQRNQVVRQCQSTAAETARNEVLVIRPKDGQPSKASQRQRTSRHAANNEQKRRQLLARQRRELRRLSWLRRHGQEERDAPNDMMHFALQGGSPGLKR